MSTNPFAREICLVPFALEIAFICSGHYNGMSTLSYAKVQKYEVRLRPAVQDKVPRSCPPTYFSNTTVNCEKACTAALSRTLNPPCRKGSGFGVSDI